MIKKKGGSQVKVTTASFPILKLHFLTAKEQSDFTVMYTIIKEDQSVENKTDLQHFMDSIAIVKSKA